MRLKEFLRILKPINIALLSFTEKDELLCKEYGAKEFSKVESNYLSSEVMDFALEDDCLEIWIRKEV